MTDNELLHHTSQIASAYLSNNQVLAHEVPEVIGSVHHALSQIANPPSPEKPEAKPVVDPKKSVFRDQILCLECGSPFQMLRRHIRVDHGLTPDEYRKKYHLVADYPLVSPDYAARRSDLAKKIGLGTKGGRRKAA